MKTATTATTNNKLNLSNLTGETLQQVLNIPQIIASIDQSRENFAILETRLTIAIEKISPNYPHTQSPNPAYQDTLDQLHKVSQALNSIKWSFNYAHQDFTCAIDNYTDKYETSLLPIDLQHFKEMESSLRQYNIPYTPTNTQTGDTTYPTIEVNDPNNLSNILYAVTFKGNQIELYDHSILDIVDVEDDVYKAYKIIKEGMEG